MPQYQHRQSTPHIDDTTIITGRNGVLMTRNTVDEVVVSSPLGHNIGGRCINEIQHTISTPGKKSILHVTIIELSV